MTTRCPNLMVVDGLGGRTELLEMSCSGWTRTASAGSREEMDLKLAVMGLKTDWDGYDWNDLVWSTCQYRVWRIQ